MMRSVTWEKGGKECRRAEAVEEVVERSVSCPWVDDCVGATKDGEGRPFEGVPGLELDGWSALGSGL